MTNPNPWFHNDKGVQPVADDVLVDVEYNNGGLATDIAKDFDWGVSPDWAFGTRFYRLHVAEAKEVEVSAPANFQSGVKAWMLACFGAEIATDKIERNHRFLEEALELVQASGCTVSEAHQLVDYVYGRPVGDINQEVGGVMVTLAAHCPAHGIDMDAEAKRELARIWTKVEQIRAKQAESQSTRHCPPRVILRRSAPSTPSRTKPSNALCVPSMKVAHRHRG